MKAVVLHSGGLDSTLCLLMAREAGREVVSLGIDYGQRHGIELEYALAQCRQHGIERRVIRVEWDKPVRDIPTGRSLEEIRAGVSSAFLPARNVPVKLTSCSLITLDAGDRHGCTSHGWPLLHRLGLQYDRSRFLLRGSQRSAGWLRPVPPNLLHAHVSSRPSSNRALQPTVDPDATFTHFLIS